jgi:integrase
MPAVALAVRAYSRWYVASGTDIPPRSARRGVPADIALAIWREGMQTEELPVLRDAALIICTFVLGLRASSARTLRAADVDTTDDSLTARPFVVKGAVGMRGSTPCTYRRVSGAIPSATDLLVRWNTRRPSHPQFFGLADEPSVPVAAASAALTGSLRRMCVGKSWGGPSLFTSHSLRIGAHTEQVLLGVPLEVRKARFGWAHNSAMECIYFDRSIRLSTASTWFFGAPCCEQA